MASQTTQHAGTIGVPSLLCALTGSVLAVCVEWLGFLDDVRLSLTQFWEKEPFFLVDPILISREWNWLATFCVSWLVGYFTLASDALWKRLLVGLMSGIVLLGFTPSLALWGVLWLPMVAGVAMVWAWACALLYSGQHQMPYDSESSSNEEIVMKVETIDLPTKKKEK